MKKILVALLLLITCNLQAQPGMRYIEENINVSRSTDASGGDIQYSYIIDSTSNLSKLSNLRSQRKVSLIIKLNILPKEIYLLSDTLTEITLSCQNDQLTDISSLISLKNLRSVKLCGLSNITYLNELVNLIDVSIWGYPKSELKIDLHGLIKLQTLNIEGGAAKYITATQNWLSSAELTIGNMDSLTDLHIGKMNLNKVSIYQCNSLKSISKLSDCKFLKELSLNDIYLLKKLDLNFSEMNLESLDLFYCESLSDISSIADSKSLKTLKLNGFDSLKSISFDMSKMNLENIEIKGDYYTRNFMTNIDGICGCKSIKRIFLEAMDSLKTLDFGSGNLNLEELDINECRSLKGVYGLSGSKSLNTMLIGNNASLTDIPDLNNNLSFVRWVFVHDNRKLKMADKSIVDEKTDKRWSIEDNFKLN